MAKAKKRPEQYTLYDIDAAFQNKLSGWLSKKPHGIVVDISALPDRFQVTMDPGGRVENESFETVLLEAMGSRSRKKHIDAEMESRVHAFLLSTGAHMTFGATKDIFNVVISNADSSGKASDEDFEVAIILAEEQFWDNMPEHPLALADRAALESALGAPQRAEEDEEQLRRALFEPRAELEMNRRRISYAQWIAEVNEALQTVGASTQDAQPEYWRQMFRADFAPYEASQEFLETSGSGQYAENMHPHRSVPRVDRPREFGRPLPPSHRPPDTRQRIARMVAVEEKPFDPAAPQERYARSHHFAVNARWSREYIDSLPDSAFLYVEHGGERDARGRSHPLSLRHFPYRDRSGKIDEGHLRAALARAHQEHTNLPVSVKNEVFRKAERIYEREFGYAHNSLTENGLPGRQRFMVTKRTTRFEHGHRIDELQLANRSAQGFMSLEEARAWAEHNRVGPYEIYPYVVGSDQDPSTWEHWATPQPEGFSRAGSWRIRVAGNDVDPTPFDSMRDANQYALQKYGQDGWSIERHAR